MISSYKFWNSWWNPH